MSENTLTTLANTPAPAHIANRQTGETSLTASVAGGISMGMNVAVLSIRGKRFHIVREGVEDTLKTLELPVVIVAANEAVSKTYYAKDYVDGQEAEAPDCFSLDGKKPDPSVVEPQFDNCALCPNNAWGSRITQTGAKGKACADKKRLAVIFESHPNHPFLLVVPPTSLKPLKEYVTLLENQGYSPEVVVTKLSFDDSAAYSLLKFEFGGFIGEDLMSMLPQITSGKALEIVNGIEVAPAPLLESAAEASTGTGEEATEGVSIEETFEATATAEPVPTEATEASEADLELPEFLRRDSGTEAEEAEVVEESESPAPPAETTPPPPPTPPVAKKAATATPTTAKPKAPSVKATGKKSLKRSSSVTTEPKPKTAPTTSTGKSMAEQLNEVLDGNSDS